MPFCNVQCSNRRFKQHIYLPVSTNSTQTLIWKIPKGYATKRLRTNDLPLTRPPRRHGPRHCLPDHRWLVLKIHKKIKKNYKTQENQKTSSKTLENPKTKSTSLLSFFLSVNLFTIQKWRIFFLIGSLCQRLPFLHFRSSQDNGSRQSLISEQLTFLQLTNSWHEVNDRDPSGHADLLVVHRLPSGQLLPRQRYDLVQFWFG